MWYTARECNSNNNKKTCVQNGKDGGGLLLIISVLKHIVNMSICLLRSIRTVSKPSTGASRLRHSCISPSNLKYTAQNAKYGSVFKVVGQSSIRMGLNGLSTVRLYSKKHHERHEIELLSDATEQDFLDDFGKKRKEERMFLIQPDFKWGKGRFLSRSLENRLEEAEALVKSVENWKVKHKTIESLHELNSKYFFGTGKIAELKVIVDELKKKEDLTAVFINTGKLTQKQASELEDMLSCKIYDRYRIVLEIFKERAKTKEAKLQVRLAELKYMRYIVQSFALEIKTLLSCLINSTVESKIRNKPLLLTPPRFLKENTAHNQITPQITPYIHITPTRFSEHST